MLISTAYASETVSSAATAVGATQSAGSLAMTFAPLVLVFIIFYLFLVRPQQKGMMEFQKLVAGLRRGDRVVTTGGIIGTITKVETNAPEVMVEIAEGVRVRVQRGAIAEVLAKTSPVGKDDDTATDSEKKSA